MSMDLLTFTIPNWLCAVLLLGYLVFATPPGVPAIDILLSYRAPWRFLMVAFVMLNFVWVGAGAAKLAAATAAWSKLWDCPPRNYGVAAAFFGGIHADHCGARTAP